MKLPAGAIKTFKDIQLNFEKLTTSVVAAPGGRELREGKATVNWTLNVVDSSAVVVSHGLPTVPVAVVATDTGGDRWAVVQVSAFTATTFTVQATSRDATGSLPAGTQTISWMAVA
jgi:hypothetical protein